MDTLADNAKRIVVWGVKGVGKSSMIRILRKDMETLTHSLSNYKFRVKNRAKNPTELPEATQKFEYTSYEIQIDGPKQYNRNYELSIFDDSGDAMENALKNLNDDKYELITSNLDTAQGVVAIIDPITAIDEKNRSLVDLLDEMIFRLDQRQEEVLLAICLNKVDTLELRWKDPEVMFELVLGSSWRKLKQSIASVKSVKIAFFSMSTTGYYVSRKETVPNFYGNELVDANIWQPWNVYAPFLWMFNQFDSQSTIESIFSNLFSRKGTSYPKALF